MNPKAEPVIGKHTLETLTTGMYKNPFDALREYLQNSADAIDKAIQQKVLKAGAGEITVTINPTRQSVAIRDNGIGLSTRDGSAALRDVGRSEKLGARARGFRGIGRLGGLGYCEELVFRTKCQGDGQCIVQRWNASKLREALMPRNKQHMTMGQVIDAISSLYTEKHIGDSSDHFFEVNMVGVREEGLLDLPAVRAYLSETIPIQFDFQAFKFGKDIDSHLRRIIPDYATYSVLVNDEPLFKPYRDTVPLSKGPNREANSERERIDDIQWLTLSDRQNRPVAQAWIGQTDLKGTISPDCGMAGVRMRCGNMLIGDGGALERAFQKSNRRFAGYLVGEVHSVCDDLVPNARRDDFESNAASRMLLDAISREVCIPASEVIRRTSRARSKSKRTQKAEKSRLEAEGHIQRGVVAEGQRQDILRNLRETARDLSPDDPKQAAETTRIEETAQRLKSEAHHIVDVELQSHYPKATREDLKLIFDMIYEDHPDKPRAARLIQKIIGKLKSTRR